MAAQVGADFYPSTPSQTPLHIVESAIDYAKKHYYDVLIVDTAGRLAIDDVMMDEIAALQHALTPAETLFVIDAMQGQDAVKVAQNLFRTAHVNRGYCHKTGRRFTGRRCAVSTGNHQKTH